MTKTVMVVDDQPGIRLLFQEILKQDGHRVVTAENGKEALDKIEKEQPDLLILDYNLPIMNGKDLLHSLEQRELHVPAILMSGLSERLREEKDRFKMVEKIFSKPFDIKEVRNDINNILKKSDFID